MNLKQPFQKKYVNILIFSLMTFILIIFLTIAIIGLLDFIKNPSTLTINGQTSKTYQLEYLFYSLFFLFSSVIIYISYLLTISKHNTYPIRIINLILSTISCVCLLVFFIYAISTNIKFLIAYKSYPQLTKFISKLKFVIFKNCLLILITICYFSIYLVHYLKTKKSQFQG